jgi:hypothetical protein
MTTAGGSGTSGHPGLVRIVPTRVVPNGPYLALDEVVGMAASGRLTSGSYRTGHAGPEFAPKIAR